MELPCEILFAGRQEFQKVLKADTDSLTTTRWLLESSQKSKPRLVIACDHPDTAVGQFQSLGRLEIALAAAVYSVMATSLLLVRSLSSRNGQDHQPSGSQPQKSGEDQ